MSAGLVSGRSAGTPALARDGLNYTVSHRSATATIPVTVKAGAVGDDTLTGGTGADAFAGGACTDKATDLTTSQGDTQDGSIP